MSDVIPARLYSIGAKRKDIGDVGLGLCINFPALPDVLTFAREAEYQVPKTQFHPDGLIHIFQSNTLLNIPVSFKLHAADDTYCKSAVDLLWMAAALQAFTLPMTRGKTRLPGVPVTDRGFVTPRTEASTGAIAVGGGKLEGGSERDGLRFPAVAILDLMMATGSTKETANGVGVRMAGYVKSAEIKMYGPWLQVSNSAPAAAAIPYLPGVVGVGLNAGDVVHNAGTRNLPTRAEFNFTFVHAPSYRNFFRTYSDTGLATGATVSGYESADTAATNIQTDQTNKIAAKVQDYFGQGYAEYVRDYFYNTLALFDNAALTNADAVMLEPGTNQLNVDRRL